MDGDSGTGLIDLGRDTWAVVMSIIPPEGGGPNAGFFLAGDGVVVIDSLVSPNFGQQLLNYVREVTDKPVAYLINTHAHGDHVFGNQALSPPAVVIAHHGARDALVSQGQAMVRSFAERFADAVPDIKETTVIPPTVTYSQHMTLHLGDRTVQLLHLGVAHTEGDTVVYLPEEKLLYAGDLLFNHIFPPIFGSSAGWIAAIEHMEAMDVDTIVPGHGFLATKKDLIELKRCLLALREAVAECFDRGLSAEEATKRIEVPYLQWPRSERLPVAVQTIYRELSASAT
ncbi:MAG: MBL fold metallo-hydrolase [Chloroflexota bacterium]